MADTFHVTADSIYFRGYEVATLRHVPATVRDAVETALHGYHPDAIDPDEHKGDLDALEEAEGKVHDLTERVRELERELKDECDTVTRLQDQIAALETELEALEAKQEDANVEIRALNEDIERLEEELTTLKDWTP